MHYINVLRHSIPEADLNYPEMNTDNSNRTLVVSLHKLRCWQFVQM